MNWISKTINSSAIFINHLRNCYRVTRRVFFRSEARKQVALSSLQVDITKCASGMSWNVVEVKFKITASPESSWSFLGVKPQKVSCRDHCRFHEIRHFHDHLTFSLSGLASIALHSFEHLSIRNAQYVILPFTFYLQWTQQNPKSPNGRRAPPHQRRASSANLSPFKRTLSPKKSPAKT